MYVGPSRCRTFLSPILFVMLKPLDLSPATSVLRGQEEYVDGVGSPKKSTLEPAIDPMLVAALNARADKTWTAEQSPRFENYSVMDARCDR